MKKRSIIERSQSVATASSAVLLLLMLATIAPASNIFDDDWQPPLPTPPHAVNSPPVQRPKTMQDKRVEAEHTS